MIGQLSHGQLSAILELIVWGWMAGVASAQTPQPPSSLAALRARVPIRDVVYVTDSGGRTIKGRLTAASDDAVQVSVKGTMRSVTFTDLRRVQWLQPDSPLTGVLIGAAIGAAPGVYWLIADPNECTGMCPEEYAFIAVGAAVGGLIDLAIKRKVTVYTAAPSTSRQGRVTVRPLVSRDRQGMQIAVTF